MIAREDRAEPVPCDIRRHSVVLPGTYTVPEDPPALIDIRAEAVDHDNQESVDAVQYFVGEVWTGTFPLSAKVEGTGNPVLLDVGRPSPDRGRSRRFAVGKHQRLVHQGRGGPDPSLHRRSPGGGQATVPVSGSRDGNRFDVAIAGPAGAVSLVLSVTGQTSQGSTQMGGYIAW